MGDKRIQRKIVLFLSEKEMDLIEDSFFYELSEEYVQENQNRVNDIWEKLCKAMEDSQTKEEAN